MAILNRLRGNPEGLARISISLLALTAFFAILCFSGSIFQKAPSNVDPKVLIGALLGGLASVAVAAIIPLLIRFLAEPDLRGVPRTFLDAAIQDVHNTGYYCRGLKFTIELEEENQLIFSYSSSIVPVRESSKMSRPKVEAPDGLTLLSVDYTHNGLPQVEDALIPLDGNTREDCKIVYNIINSGGPIKIEDKHRWRCPVEDLELTVKLPLEYKIKAFTLRGEHRETLDAVTSHTAGERRFAQRGASFSHQGFLWSIEKT